MYSSHHTIMHLAYLALYTKHHSIINDNTLLKLVSDLYGLSDELASNFKLKMKEVKLKSYYENK